MKRMVPLFFMIVMEDKGCPSGGGGGNHNNPYGTFAGDGSPCVYDSMGWCDSACGSCTWG